MKAPKPRWGLLLLLYSVTATIGFALASPIAALTGSLFGHRSERDALLWEEGGFHLLEAARALQNDAMGAITLAPAIAIAVTVVTIIPWAALLIGLCDPQITVSGAVSGGIERMPALLLVHGVSFAVQAVTTGLGAMMVTIAPGVSGSERGDTIAVAVAVALGLLLLAVVRVAHDLATAAACRQRGTGVSALLEGAAALARAPLGSLLAYLGRAALALVTLIVAAAVVGAIGVSSADRVVAVALVHQTALFGLVALRASWLRRALELVPHTPGGL